MESKYILIIILLSFILVSVVYISITGISETYIIDVTGDETVFDEWDKDSSDDFDGLWKSLKRVPSGFLDGIDNYEADTTDTNWDNLTNMPSGFADGVDNTSTLSSFTRKEGVWISATAIRAPGSKPASIVDHGCSVAWEFSDNQEETITFNFRIPLSINLSYETIIIVGWSSPATSKNCDWELNYTITAPDEDTTTACEYGNQTYATSSSTANGLILTTFNITDIASGDKCIHLKLMRDGNDGLDTLADNAHVHGICMKYYMDYTIM